MIGEKMQKAMNDQINAELYSSYLYLSMAAYFQAENLSGFAKWMTVQTQEEVVHAMRFFKFLNERGGRVVLQPVQGPEKKWDSPLAAFEAAYKHELGVTARINNLVQLAREEGDHASEVFLQWFVSEQVEEEASSDEIVRKLKRMADAPGAMFLLDHELGARKFNPPASEGE